MSWRRNKSKGEANTDLLVVLERLARVEAEAERTKKELCSLESALEAHKWARKPHTFRTVRFVGGPLDGKREQWRETLPDTIERWDYRILPSWFMRSVTLVYKRSGPHPCGDGEMYVFVREATA